MIPDKLHRVQEVSNELASLLYEEVNPEELLTLKDIENSVRALKLSVDDREAEAIALASEYQCRLIVDDLQARKVAQTKVGATN